MKVKSAFAKNKLALISSFCILILLILLNLSGLIFNHHGQANEVGKQNNNDSDEPQFAPTPPTSLVSNRCSAYTAPTVPAPLRTFYINASSGSDSNNGTSPATAWKTLQKANDTAIAGDLFYLRGVWGSGQWISPNNSGTASNKITYRKEPGQEAVIEIGRFDGGIILNGTSHIVVDGVEIRNVVESVKIAGGGNNNWLRNLYVHNGGQTTIREGGNTNRIEDSVFTDMGSEAGNSGDALILYGDADNNVIVRNYFGNAGHGGFDITIVSSGVSDDNVFAQNIVDNQWSSNVIIGGGANRTTVECNIIKNATQNSSINYPRAGMYLSGDNNTIRYNYLYNNRSHGIVLEGYIFGGLQQYPESNLVYHNTATGNGGAGLLFVIHDPNSSDHGYVRNNTIENNIFWNNVGYNSGLGANYEVVGDFYQSNGPLSTVFPDGNIFRYNNASTTPVKFLGIAAPGGNGNQVYDTTAAAQTAFPTWTNNTVSNPLFANPSAGDYSLQAGSPMIDTGRIISGLPYNGSAPDRGAFETGSGTPTPTPTATPTPAQAPYPGPNAPTLPATLEAENFDKGGSGIAYVENYGDTGSSTYRANPVESVDLTITTNASNNVAVFQAAANEWLEYTINVPSSGLYDFVVRYSNGYTEPNSHGIFRIEVCEPTAGDGVTNCVSTGSITVTTTGSFGIFQTITKPRFFIPSSGTRILRLMMVTNSPGDTGCNCVVANFDSIAITKTPVKALFDYDNDGKSDVSVFRPSDGNWHLQRSTAGYTVINYGLNGDVIAPGDFDGDGKTDTAVFRPSTNVWYILRTSDGGSTVYQFGLSGDIPVQADYDGDGKADIAVWRPSTGVWYYVRSSNGVITSVGYGINGDLPAVGDYNGDGSYDLAVFRPSEGKWYINNIGIVPFGTNGDKITPADYDGDGKTDLAVFRPSTNVWYILRSSDNTTYVLQFGISNDKPVPADYDGDGKADIAVYRPTSPGVWHLQQTTAGYTSVQFGTGADIPTPSTYVR